MKPNMVAIIPLCVMAWQPVQSQWVRTGASEAATFHAIAASGGYIYAGLHYPGGVIHSTNNGTSWSAVDSVLGTREIRSLAVLQKEVFAGTVGGGIFRSTDFSTSWTAVNSGLGDVGSVAVQAFAVKDSNLFAGTTAGLFLSTNHGTNWTRLLNGSFQAIATSGMNLFVGGPTGIGYSTSPWTSWIAANEGLTELDVRSLAISGEDLYAGTFGGGVFHSTDNGASWTALKMRPESYWVTSSAIVDTNLYIGTLGGLYLTSNKGLYWADVNYGLEFHTIITLAVVGTNLFAAPAADGIWRRPLSEMIASVDSVAGTLPREFFLGQNYPNPLNPSTTIRYALPSRSHVTLTVYNTLGQIVRELVNGEMEAGYHQVEFDASGLSSGVYFYRMRAGDFIETRRLLLIR